MHFHISVTRGFLWNAVVDSGTKALICWEGTRKEALEAIRNDSREYFVLASCDNMDESGRCKGHEEGE